MKYVYNYDTDAFDLIANQPSDVGLGNVDNTSDLDKPISNLTNQALNALSTTLLTGGMITIAGDNLTFSIGSGSGVIVDNTTNPSVPVRTLVSWTAKNNITPDFLATADGTFLSIDDNGDLVMTEESPADDQFSTNILLGWVEHTNRTTINTFLQEPYFIPDLGIQFHQFLEHLGAFNIYGNDYFGNGNLTIGRTEGEIFDGGSGYSQSNKTPNEFYSDAVPVVTFSYYYQDGLGDWVNDNPVTTTIDPNYYDDGSGTLAAVPSTKWTIQPLYLYVPTESNDFVYGQAVYNSKEEAIANLSTLVVTNPWLDYNVLRGYLVVKQGTTDLTNTANCQFISVSKFGTASASVSTGGGDITDHEQRQNVELLYNQSYSTAYHEITYDESFLITQIDVWENSSKLVKLFTKVVTWAGGLITQITITDEINSHTLVKDISYDVNNRIENIEKTFT